MQETYRSQRSLCYQPQQAGWNARRACWLRSARTDSTSRTGNPLWLPFVHRAPIAIRARRGACPYGYQSDDAMDVVGHDYECINVNAGVMTRYGIPH